MVADYLTLIGALFLHIPNEGQRSPVTAAVLKRLGLKKGAPDLIIFEPRGKYHGFAIEMKAAGGRLTPDQRMMLFELSKRQYATSCCHGADEAIKKIRLYMSLEPNKQIHAHWEKTEGDTSLCSHCRAYWIAQGDEYDYKYCPRCGAEMDEIKTEENNDAKT